MRLSSVLELARQYLLLGAIFAVFAAAAAVFGYFFVYKKTMKGEKRLSPAMMLWSAVFLCYLIVVFGGVMLSRGGIFGENSVELIPFSSYREAWITFDRGAWRNIILNIALFVPLGFLLPLGIRWFRRFWRTYLAGLFLTGMIEGAQLIFHRGIFEIDDIIDNLLGAMIGYGFFSIVFCIAGKVKKRPVKILSAVVLQIPLIGTVALFSVIFGMYAAQDLGNLPLTSAAGSFGDGLSIVTERQYSEERKVLPVYEIAVASREETRSQAGAFFRNTGTELDESRTDLYDDTAVYYDRNGNSLWIDYAGSVYSYTDFDAAFDESAEKKTDASEAEIVSALEGLGVSLPEGGVFAGGEEGRYRIDYRRNVLDDVMYDGSVNCTYLKDGRISELRYHVFACEIYKEYQVISEQAAYQRIVSGEFGGSAEGDSEICLGDVSITYMIDSKGFYQPVYRFEIQGTGSSADVPNREGQILVPALENK